MRLIRPIAAAVTLTIAIMAIAAWLTLRASLPQLTGVVTISSSGLGASASIERDAVGTPTIKASNRRDLSFATGFAHAQDRFFQMDLMRRMAAGELSELLGPALLDNDKDLRRHDFQRVAAEVLAKATSQERSIMDAYCAGVNAGLASLGSRPWEYHLLRSEPRAWTPQDSLLAAFTMHLSLNDSSGDAERALTVLRDSLPPELFAFLHQYGTSWDAPLTGGTWQPPPIPGPETVDLHKSPLPAHSETHAVFTTEEFPGSNSWAVAGSRAAGGGALLANDMHLSLRLPHTWYRARLMVDVPGDARRDLVGVTLPGLPLLIVGSNGHVAWGFTNSYGDWTDVVLAETDSAAKDHYRYAEGSEPYRVRRETIKVRGQAPVEINVQMTRWGPVIDHDAKGNAYVVAWTAHHERASNLHLLELEQAASVESALAVANRAGVPVQNFMVADSGGHIGWTLMGQVPVRANYDSSVVSSWRESQVGWIGWRTPEEYPRIVDPPSGRLWTANARTIDAKRWLDFLGNSDYVLGARAAQIRDDLLALDQATIEDMRKIQLDDRALFLERWRSLLQALLTKEAVGTNTERAEALRLITHWSQHAAINDAGYRIVRAFRARVRDDVFDTLVGAVIEKYPDLDFTVPTQFEGPLWQIITERPEHFLPSQFPNWDAALLDSLDRALEALLEECDDLGSCTWGQRNTLTMQHPLSSAIPWLGRWIDMPPQPLPGDEGMPRVQGPAFGASQRMVVSPGREAEGILQLPGGPVDHPLSPFYGAGHEAWAKGEAQPLLPGAVEYALRLEPQRRP